ncbi:MAG TPA: hypothetical protein DCP47_07010 [Phycisphaerales bacterium]|nr:hypothetical protein [Phycisphaerales bacterium]
MAAIDDKSSLIAVPAVSGLLRIDQAGAFEVLKSKNFVGHSSGKIRTELISVAGQIGTAQDLEWLNTLAETAETDVERQQAADAMMNIFQYCQTDVLIIWGQNLAAKAKSKNDEILFTKSRMLFEAAEKKAEAQQDANTLVSLRHRLADAYSDTMLYVPAAKYYGMLLQDVSDPNEKETLTARLLDVNIRGGQIESAKQLLTNVLLTGDIDENRQVAQVLDKYFSDNRGKERAAKILRSIASIEIAKPQNYPQWTLLIAKWRVMAANDAKAAEPNSLAVTDSNSAKAK